MPICLTKIFQKKLLSDESFRLGQGLSFFKRVQNVDQLNQDASNLKVKLANKFDISKFMKDYVIIPFAEAHSLNINTAFLLLDEYFRVQSQRLMYFINLEKYIEDIEKSMMSYQQGIYGNFSEHQKRFDTYQQEIKNHAATIVTEAKQTYFDERNSLFSCLIICINQAQTNGPFRELFDDFIHQKLIKEQKLPQNLIEGLIRNLEWDQEFKNDNRNFNSTPEQTRQQIISRLQLEQILQLKILFALYFKNHFPKANEVSLMLQYMQLSLFSGQLGKNYRIVDPSEHYQYQKELISALGKVTCLCMLQLHKINFVDSRGKVEAVVTHQDKEIWSQVINTKELSEANSPFFFAIVKIACLNDRKGADISALEKTQEVLEFFKEFKAKSTIHEIGQLINSSAFIQDSLRPVVGSFYHVIKAWLNLAFPFFKENRMDEEMQVTQSLSMHVLKNEENVRAIWNEYELNGDVLQKSLQMFDGVLRQPIQNIHGFLQLSDVLCGKNKFPYAKKVLQFMQKQKNKNGNFVTELFGWCAVNIQKINDRLISEQDVHSISSAFVIFSKMIKQKPALYSELNSIYIDVIERNKQNEIHFEFDVASNRHSSHSPAKFVQYCVQQDLEKDNNPFLSLMVRALHGFLSIDFNYSNRVIANILDALSVIYKYNKDIRMELVDMLQSQYQNNNIFESVDYFSRCFIDNESNFRKYKQSESFIKLLCKIFKSTFPQECLCTDYLLDLNKSFLAQTLEYVYLPIVQNYQSLKFKDSASFGNLIFRLIKLYRLLLQKFIEVPQSYKAHLHQPTPKFDYLLQIIVITLNAFDVQKMCLNILELKEQKSGSFKSINKYENKLICEALQNRFESNYQLNKMQKMIIEALATINTLIKVGMVDDEKESSLGFNDEQDYTGTKTSYIRQLDCVQSLKVQVLEPQKAQPIVVQCENGSSTSHSIFSLFAHYVNPSEYLQSPQIEQQALQFFKFVCQFWKNNLQEARIPNLLLLLKQDMLLISQQIQDNFSLQMIRTFKREVNQNQFFASLRFIDFLCIIADTQPKFLETILSPEASTNKNKEIKLKICESFVQLIKGGSGKNASEEQVQQQVELVTKIIIFFSLIAQRRLCHDILSYKEYEIVQLLFNFGLQDFCLKKIQSSSANIILNGEYIQPYVHQQQGWRQLKEKRDLRALSAYNLFMAKIGVQYFMKLLSSEYQRDPTTNKIRQFIVKIFENEHFKNLPFPSTEMKPNLNDLFQYTKVLNNIIKQNGEERDYQLQSDQYDRLHNMFQQKMQENEKSALQSQEGEVDIDGLFGYELYENLSKVELYKLVLGEQTAINQTSINSWKNSGCLGTEFYVSTRELEYVMKKEFFKNIFFIRQAKAMFQEFNLAMSHLFTEISLTQAKQDFILQIGKVALRESQNRVSSDLQIKSSLIPLVTSEQLILSNEDQLSKYSNQIVKLMYDQAIIIQKQLTGQKISSLRQMEEQKADFTQNYFMIKMHECQLESLITALSVITSQIRYNSMKKLPTINRLDPKLRKDLEHLVTVNLIPSLCDLFNFENQDFTQSKNINKQYQAKIKSQIRTNEQVTFELFTQIAFQTLQIYQAIQESSQSNKVSNASFEQKSNKTEDIERKKYDFHIVKILSKVVESLRKDIAFERCLHIFQICLSLLDINSMQVFMRKQDHLPIREVLLKFNVSSYDGKQQIAESSSILQLLQSYAQTEEGAIHLKEIRILDELAKSECLRRIQEQDLYVTTQTGSTISSSSSQIQVRNPFHMQWCQTLVLLRTLNNHLLEDPINEHSDYFIRLLQLIQMYTSRFSSVLHLGITYAKNHDQIQGLQSMDTYAFRNDDSQKMVSLAILEETELIMAVLSQLFQHAHIWQQKDSDTFGIFKDYVLFGIPKLLTFCESRAIQPISATELHLKTIIYSAMDKSQYAANMIGDQLANNESEFSALSLKAEVSLAKTFMTSSYSILNCLLLTKEGVDFNKEIDLIQTWYDSHHKINSLVLDPHQIQRMQILDVIKFAFETQYNSQERMLEKLNILKKSKDQGTSKVFSYMNNIMQNDQWIQQEYAGGMNCVLSVSNEFGATPIQELYTLIETGLSMSSQISCLLLEILRDCLFQSINGHQYNYQSDSGEERRDIILMTKALNDLVTRINKESESTLLDRNQGKEIEQLDKEFFDKVNSAVNCIEQSISYSTGYQPNLQY